MTERWPTDIVEAREAEMLARLRAAETDLAPLREAVAGARHPWGWICLAIFVLGSGLVYFIFNISEGIGLLSILALLGALIWAGIRYGRATKILTGQRDVLDERLVRDVLEVTEMDTHPSDLAPFEDAGVFGRYEDIRILRSFRSNGRDVLFARLTKTETSTDSDGNRKTRTVTVFRGLLFSLPAPFAEGLAVTCVSTGRHPRPRGRFARHSASNKRIKPDRIKTASLEFNKHHKVSTTDSVVGHTILDPDRVMRLINMEHDLSDAIRWGRSSYAMLFTQGRVWVAVSNVSLPTLKGFAEGRTLEKELCTAHAPLTLPAVMAHHLRLPPDTETPT